MDKKCQLIYTSVTSWFVQFQELYKNPLAWVNTAIFDYRNQLKTGAMSLYAWKISEDQIGESMPNPLGTLVSNPDRDQAVTLTITFPRFSSTSSIMFPAKDRIVTEAKENPQCDEVCLLSFDFLDMFYIIIFTDKVWLCSSIISRIQFSMNEFYINSVRN